MKTKRTQLATAVGLAHLSAIAHAQQELALEEIVVTAEQREESLQEVPVSVTAFGENDIASAGIESSQDFINLTPNVTLDDSFTVGNTFVTIRGVAQINNADSPVAVVIDGVPQGNQKQFKQELFDIERIEVLRGPQGALYGRNAIGGAINIVTKQTGNELDGFLRLGVSNGSGKKLSAGIGMPLVEDTLFLRLAGNYKDSDGLIENVTLRRNVDESTSKDARLKLLWLASDSISVDFRYNYSDLEGGAISDSALGPGAQLNSNRILQPSSNILGHSQRQIDGFSAKLDWEVGEGTLSYIAAYTDLTENYFGDLDFTAAEFLDQAQDLDVKLKSQELRYTSADEESFRWIAGAYYQQTDRSLSTVARVEPASAGLFGGSGYITLVNTLDDNDNTATAVFSQFEYDLSEETELSFSLRYDRDERDQISSGRSATFSAWQPKLTLTHLLNDDHMVYATYSTGFRSGGFNADGSLFSDENLSNYELGFKSSLWQQRILLNGAAYFSQSKDFQFFFIDLNRGGAQVIDNIDKTDIKGLELEFQMLLAENLRVFGGLGITDSEIKSFGDFPDQVGNHTPKTTRFTGNLGIQHTIGINSDWQIVSRLDAERRGRKFWHPDNIENQDPLTLLSARLSLQSDDVSFSLWGRNLSNERYYADFNDLSYTGLPSGQDIGFLAQPRSYGLDFEVRFK
ncbi:TonB-dependent receptor [Pseudoteredinibacter isoporae]|uniref:TonB-dependent receptor n=1 Tax=Pseudoteredinibacter isoporae TaxID=570281 RepID=UPI003104A641